MNRKHEVAEATNEIRDLFYDAAAMIESDSISLRSLISRAERILNHLKYIERETK